MLLRATRAAGLAVLVSWGLLVLLCIVGWLSTSATTVPLSSAVGVASLAWAVAHLGSVSDGTTTISLAPLGLLALPLASTVWAARTLRPVIDDDRTDRVERAGGVRRGTLTALGAFLGLYLLLGQVVAALGHLLPMRAGWWQTLLGTAVVALVGLGAGLRPSLTRDDFAPALRDRARALFPPAVRRGTGVGLTGTGLLLAAGLLPVLASLVMHWGAVRDVQTGLHPGIVGGLLLVLAQLLLVPNLAAWGLSWLAGPGFQVGTVSTFTWTRSTSTLLPNIPVLGALPDSGDQPGWLALALLLPVGVGYWLGHRSLGQLSRLSAVTTKVQAVAVAVVTATLGALLVLVLSGGALGTRSLSVVGPRSLTCAAALLAELAGGAAVALLVSLWRFNRVGR